MRGLSPRRQSTLWGSDNQREKGQGRGAAAVEGLEQHQHNAFSQRLPQLRAQSSQQFRLFTPPQP
eukprot:184622-Chlamydomonas_euryale.AAC.2